MIKVNGAEVKINHFPDKTQSIQFPGVLNVKKNVIFWFYDSDEEFFTLSCTVDWLRRTCGERIPIALHLPYLPNARMDRIKGSNENFSLKVFCGLLNSLGFCEVQVYNVHSTVSEALINNIISLSPAQDIKLLLDRVKPDVIFFPDEGACKRYSDLSIIKESNIPVAFGIKKRDWKTGNILGLSVMTDGTDLTGKRVLIIDDICSAGGTFKFSAIKLKELGAKEVFLYISHCEDNIQNGDLLKGDLISRIYTTDSILHIDDPKIEVIQNFR